MRKTLVTGGCGFVGRHLCHTLLQRGDKVICVDNIVNLTGGICPVQNQGWPLYNPLDFQNFVYIKQDCREFFLNNQDTDFDEVYHLAAIVGGREMIENQPLAVAEDLAIDALFWQWAVKTRPKKIVCFSSSAAYPIKYQTREYFDININKNKIFLTENMINFEEMNHDIGLPDLSYGWAKLTHEYLARLAYFKHGLNSVTYRPFSGYGEDQDSAYPFPSLCKRALLLSKNNNKNNKLEFLVWGTGDQMRDFIHIEDCIQGILTTMYKIEDGSAINLSTGIATAFKAFAKTVTEILGYQPVIIPMSDKPEGVFARVGCTNYQKSLGFTSQIDLHHGILRALKYLENKI